MPKTILIHSFHHGVGRSNMTANLAYLLAAMGQRVGIIDTDTSSPTIHRLVGLKEEIITYSFNDFLGGKCNLEQAAYNVTSHLDKNLKGHLFLTPANTISEEPARELNDSQDVDSLNSGCQKLMEALKLDILLIDTQPGVSQKSLVSITIADTLVIILRLNQPDYQGTSVTVDVVRQLSIPRVVLIVNEAPKTFNFAEIKAKMERTYNCEVAAILPHVDEMMALANNDIFALRYPKHPMTATLNEAAANLIA